ncbi:MAG: 50S ribosomal protein L6 [Candidatus Pacearchaeota archaeon]
MKHNKNKEKKEDSGINEIIEIPNGIDVSLNGQTIIFSKNNNEIKRKLNSIVKAKIENNKIILTTKKSRKKEWKMILSDVSHIKNIIKGFSEPFKYKLQVANVHFPITIEHDKINNRILIKNFLGEKTPRVAKVYPNVDIKINKDIIELSSIDIESAGQSAANIEKATKVRFKDRRVFQDGIYIIEKPGRNFLE